MQCVCGKRVGVNSIHGTTCGYGRCSGVRGSLARVAQGYVCKVCRAGGRKAADEFHFEDVKLECVYEFAYLGDMLNDTGGVVYKACVCSVLMYGQRLER